MSPAEWFWSGKLKSQWVLLRKENPRSFGEGVVAVARGNLDGNIRSLKTAK